MVNKSQYIDLVDGPDRITDNAEPRYKPETRTVYLSGNCLRLFRNRSRGIKLQEGDQRPPIQGMPKFLKILFYGLSFALVVSGAIIMVGKSRGK